MTDVALISLAFGLSLLAQQGTLPPLVDYPAAGFALYVLGETGGEICSQFADTGVTLPLFTIGLKLKASSPSAAADSAAAGRARQSLLNMSEPTHRGDRA